MGGNISRQVPEAAAVVSQGQFEVPKGSCWGQPCCEALHLVLACTMQPEQSRHDASQADRQKESLVNSACFCTEGVHSQL